MPKIFIEQDKKTGQVKYKLTLPKESMETLAVQKGDLLILKSVVGNEITFTFQRNQ